MVKEVFAAFPAGAVAGPRQFRGQAAMGDQSARWDLAITGEQPPLRPLRPQALYQAPLPRTKLEATVYGEAWRAPIGRIHWAGAECAPEWNGYMGGAVRSGEAAADIADEEDRDLVLADLETIPGQPRYW